VAHKKISRFPDQVFFMLVEATTSTNKTAVATRSVRSLSSSIASWSDTIFFSNVWIVVIMQR
jgi:hypothetical protein